MTNNKIQLHVQILETQNGMRLDQALAISFQDYSRSHIQEWIKQGYVTVDGDVVTMMRKKAVTGQQVTIDAPIRIQQNWQAQDIPLEIIYEDADLLIVNKTADLVVHPAAGNPDNTLANALIHYAPELQHVPRSGIVHRIDKDTTGLLVVARNLKSHKHLAHALHERQIKREYETIVYGEIISGGRVDAPIGRHPKHRTKMGVREGGRDAVTHYRILEKFPSFTHCRVQLETGRTHQIRVHMAHIHFPVVGDPLYTSKNKISKKWPETLQTFLREFNRQALHAAQLTLHHPSSGEEMVFQAPLPDDMAVLLSLLKELDK